MLFNVKRFQGEYKLIFNLKIIKCWISILEEIRFPWKKTKLFATNAMNLVICLIIAVVKIQIINQPSKEIHMPTQENKLFATNAMNLVICLIIATARIQIISQFFKEIHMLIQENKLFATNAMNLVIYRIIAITKFLKINHLFKEILIPIQLSKLFASNVKNLVIWLIIAPTKDHQIIKQIYNLTNNQTMGNKLFATNVTSQVIYQIIVQILWIINFNNKSSPIQSIRPTKRWKFRILTSVKLQNILRQTNQSVLNANSLGIGRITVLVKMVWSSNNSNNKNKVLKICFL